MAEGESSENKKPLGGNLGRKRLVAEARAWVLANRGLGRDNHILIIMEKTGCSPKMAEEIYNQIVAYEKLRKSKKINSPESILPA